MISLYDANGMVTALSDVRAAIDDARAIADTAVGRREFLFAALARMQARLIEHVCDVLEARTRAGDGGDAVATMKEIDRRLAVDLNTGRMAKDMKR